MGTSHIELVQRIPEGFEVPAPKKIYEGRYWGDPGFIHLCFDIRNMEAIRECAESLGHSFVCDGGRDFKMGEADGLRSRFSRSGASISTSSTATRTSSCPAT